jgi:LDH2 family malate/lactate/ureidoglycolate dehydrogenase
MAVPSDSWVLDMATTTVAMGKLYDTSYQGKATIPNGWAMNSAGEPTTDTDTL